VVDLTATLAALPGETATPDVTGTPTAGEPVPELGLTLQELTPDLRKEWGLTDSTQGVAVLGVEDPARTDVQEGDVIVSAHRVAVETVEGVQEAVETARAEGRSSVLLLIDRTGTRSFVAVPLVQS
jgi:serine protease Do